ncbi:related to Structure-specific endonuclease subunit SLX1 [Saccharomycodes ludwigii]|uniref:Related to Structure-specific endonuclease subunit SLX1 n=1 Tax=Saccharomycodes ludwigii TaxID=36035 RepID=A0A376B293_9ASCO|nr:hypothetical protein SCDLUD_000996 [Saccharomycodes ludwigii]KAH3903367.1 hypothetical protein SCDLUD_000996 [Saccharomycodes ludwigii]SSD58787.1 related to Structure-specific endonuclease subunit SLX1 [Saccharomycodes ludwigii]
MPSVSKSSSPKKSQDKNNDNKKISSLSEFYCCYLLRSIRKTQSFYIGSTPNPYRRLRQHNGELTRGGAYRTKRQGTRPWEMCFIVYGFPNKNSALQFEHAWQHIYESRFITNNDEYKNYKFTKSSRGLHFKIAGARMLVHCDHFKIMNLKIRCFNKSFYEAWKTNKYKLPCNDAENRLFLDIELENNDDLDIVRGKCGETQSQNITKSTQDLNPLINDGKSPREEDPSSSENDLYVSDINDPVIKIARKNLKLVYTFYLNYVDDLKNYYEKSEKSLIYGELSCELCHTSFNYMDEKPKPKLAFCYHENCNSISHLHCLYKHSTKSAGKLVPIEAKCHRCDNVLEWISVVKNSIEIKNILGN